MSDYGFFNDSPVAEHDDSIAREVERLQAELAAVCAERDQWKAAATARLAQDERIRGVVRMLGENPANVEAIESLGAELVAVCAERDALVTTASLHQAGCAALEARIADVERERDFARSERDAYRFERDALALLLADVYEHLEIEALNEALTARIEAAAYLFRDAVVAARKRQDGGPR